MTSEWRAFVGAAPTTWLASEQFPPFKMGAANAGILNRMTTTHHPRTVWPALNYADAPAAIRRLVDGFGFEERLW